MKRYILKILPLCLFFVINFQAPLSAQGVVVSEPKEEPNTIVRLGLLPPGILVEQKITPKSSVIVKLIAGFSFYYVNVNGVSDSDFKLYPTLAIEPRYYTTLDKRHAENRRTDYLSSGYVGFPVNIGLTDSSFSLGPVYGFQKTLGKKGYWHISIGLGYSKTVEKEGISPIGDFSIGFILN